MAKQKSPTQIPKQPNTPMELRSQSLIMRPWLRRQAWHHASNTCCFPRPWSETTDRHDI